MQQPSPYKPQITSSLQSTAAKGLAWVGIAQLVTQFLGLLTTIVLARLLQPAEFGLVAMANVVIGFVSVINGLGLGAAIIQKSELEDKHLNSVFIANILLGAALFLVLLTTSPIIAWFYDKPDVQPIIWVLAFTLLIGGGSATQNVLLTKKMRYNTIAKITLVGTVSQAIVSILLALAQFGSWALVIGQLIKTLILSIGFWLFTDWRPRLEFDRQAFSEMISFGLNTLGSQLTGYASTNIDNLIVGKYLGATALGYYSLAFRWSALPRQKLLGSVNEVMFPAFSMIQNDDTRLRSGYIRLLSYISFITFPLCIGIMIIAPRLVPLIYTDKWAPAVLPLQILSLGAIITTIGSPMGLIFNAKGRADLDFKIKIVSTLLLIFLIFMGLRFGLVGVAVGVSLKSFLIIWILGAKVNDLIDLKLSTYLTAFAPATAASLLMAGVLFFLQIFLDGFTSLNSFNYILIVITVGITVYIGAIKLLNPPQWSDFIKLLLQMFPHPPFLNKVFIVVEQILI
jgi:PST family polysaccharide transporter